MAQAADTRPGYYYVSVIDGGRKSLLLGPYETHQEALERVDLGRTLAEAADPRACFYSFGTARLWLDYPGGPPRGVLNDALDRRET